MPGDDHDDGVDFVQRYLGKFVMELLGNWMALPAYIYLDKDHLPKLS